MFIEFIGLMGLLLENISDKRIYHTPKLWNLTKFYWGIQWGINYAEYL